MSPSFKLSVIFLFYVLALFTPPKLSAEYKSDTPSGQNIPKLTSTPNDPHLINGHVYPNWGPVCQQYTYSVIYQDDKNRPPEYVKIYFNGQMLDMEKENPQNENYFQGIKYVYNHVPQKLGSNFYFFEASNGLGKARSNIIDSPDNGPVLFKSAFDKNEVAVIDVATKTKILSYDLADEWVGGVALSDDGQYLALKTHKKIYLFDTSTPLKPIWTYEGQSETQGDVKGGVDISGDGTRIIASIGGSAILFDNKSNQPLWIYQGSGNQAYNVAISQDGQYMAMGTAGNVSGTAQGYTSSPTTNLLILWNQKSQVPLWQYHTEGNFHDVSLSGDGSFITGATGCPDRRFYLFSKDSNIPLIRSNMLTRDSPVHRAKISADGQYIAVGSESDDGAVFLFSQDSDQPVWKFSTPARSSVRALNFTASGSYIGAATFKGDAYIFDRNSSTPVSHWKIADVSFGGIDIAEDGSFIAAAGNDGNLYIFQKDSNTPTLISFNEYVEEVDISANGKYIAAGTGGSVYFFEANDENTPAVACQEIRKPPVENTISVFQNQNINTDKIIDDFSPKFPSPGILFGIGFLVSLFSLVVYLIVAKLKKLVLNKKIIYIATIIAFIFIATTIIFLVIDNKNIQTPACGNDICQPNFSETATNCPRDCSASN